MKFTYQEQRDYETIESEIAALEEKIDMLDQEMAAASTDFVKLNQLVTDNFITDIQSTAWILTILLAITGLIGVYITYSHKYAQGRKSAITKIIEKCSQFIQMLLGKVPLFVSELYKTFILQKGIILLAAAVYLLISCRMYRGVDYSNTDFSMNNFYSMFSGNTGDKECEAYIEECRNFNRLKPSSMEKSCPALRRSSA